MGERREEIEMPEESRVGEISSLCVCLLRRPFSRRQTLNTTTTDCGGQRRGSKNDSFVRHNPPQFIAVELSLGKVGERGDDSSGGGAKGEKLL